ncbi:MAG: anaerobic magnesium-protoporphyrin IX monomethyl ester cyclase [Granulosicoccus sp.]
MANVLFTHSYFYRFDTKQWNNHKPYPPLGTITAAAGLRQAGNSVSLFDTALKTGTQELPALLEKSAPDFLVIYDDGFNYLTKMCLTNMREAAFEMIKMGKDAGCTVVVSSSDSTDHCNQYLDKGADHVIVGEGDETLKELVKAIEQGEDPILVSGHKYRIDGETKISGARPVMRDLDELPMAAWDLVDVGSYKEIWLKHHGRFSLNIATTRGCPFKCNWCAKPIYGNRYNSRSAEKVAEEIELLTTKYGATHFWMCDDIFGLKPGWPQAFEEQVRARGLKFKYMIQSRADLLLQEDTMQVLANSGLEEVWIGAESGSQKILDAMDKGTKIGQIHEATRVLKSVGVRVGFFIQFGYLGETEEDINQTIAMIKNLVPDDIGISVSYPLPGTVFYEKVKQDLAEKSNWTDSDDLDLMFQNTYQPKYYKKLHRYVHKVFRSTQGFRNLKLILTAPQNISKRTLRSVLALFYYLPTSVFDKIELKKLKG